MEVIGIKPRGYCKGVVRAIRIAKELEGKEDVYILGMIVHNQYIVDALEAKGVHTLTGSEDRMELLDQIDHGTVVITAHGAGEEVFTKARSKGLEVIDATCLDVIKTHTLIQDYLKQSKEILYIGKKGHPESEGAISLDRDHIHLITKKEDIDHLDKSKSYVITNQTTMSLYDIYDLCEYAKTVLPDLVIAKETCSATKVRQEAIRNMEEDIDVVFIVGDPHSNNTKKLAGIASSKANKETYMIESVKDIKSSMLEGKRKAGVSSGASTPTYLTNQVIDYLRHYDEYTDTPSIDMTKILD